MKLGCLWLLVASVSVAAPKKPAAVVLLLDRSAALIDSEKAAALAAVDALAPDDQIAIIALDKEASIVVPLQAASNRSRIAKAITSLQASDGRLLFPPLEEADRALAQSRLSHVILVTNGDAPSAGIPELLEVMASHHITISAIGLQGADRKLLQLISESGRLYMVDQVSSLPKIFVKEIKDALGR